MYKTNKSKSSNTKNKSSNTKNKSSNTKNKSSNTKTKKNNLQLEYVKVSYPDTLLETIKNNQDITTIHTINNTDTIYSKPPKITIQNAKSKLYLITMTDPDAPNGMTNTTNTTNTTNKNHIYTHWVYLQDMRNQNTTSSIQTLVSYAPPTPPAGIHRYQFHIYDITTLSKTILDTLKNKINNNTLDRNTYYRNNLKNLKTYKLNTLFQYKVNSNK
jgi:phosphatidylethanolamine-binding protein (PEBP) family uncharacterized protein